MPNLTDALTVTGGRRRFALPLASVPPGRATVRTVDPALYTLAETHVVLPAPDGRTADVRLDIGVLPPAGGFTDEDGLPDPALRLHAVDGGAVRFESSPDGHRLVLRTLTFASPIAQNPQARWWQRWEEAGFVPEVVVYGNVDRDQLAARLAQLTAPADVTTPAPAHFGLAFPANVTASTKDAFIAEFLAGVAAREVVAQPGAYLGVAAAGPNPGDGGRLLQLHVRYRGHTEADPRPMNPRELLNLLFGDDAAEVTAHPLLRRMRDHALTQPEEPETRRMFPRPPLRTSYRVRWEADLEINGHSGDWAPSGSLGSDRLFNTHRRGTGPYNQGDYTGSNKCNLFTSDICLRAGFRVGIHHVNPPWHYLDANSHANLVHQQKGPTDRVAVQGVSEDKTVTWGWKFEQWLRAQPAADRVRLLNEALTEEGRCFLLAGARARKFRPYTVVAGVKGIAECPKALKIKTGIGHIVIVVEVLDPPQLAATVEEGLQKIKVRTVEASGSGAVTKIFPAALGGAGGSAASASGFIRLHLVELHPGGDPDTIQGLRDLNVRTVNRNLFGTADERAGEAKINRLPTGQPTPPGQCCQDQYPPNTAAPTVVNC